MEGVNHNVQLKVVDGKEGNALWIVFTILGLKSWRLAYPRPLL